MNIDYFNLVYRNSFTALRVYNNTISPESWQISFDFFPIDEEYDHLSLNIALEKITYLIEEVLYFSLIIGNNNDWAVENLISASNNVVLCPGEPTDEMLAVLLRNKFDAIANNVLSIGIFEISSSLVNYVYFGFDENEGLIDNLPDMKSWVGEKSYFSLPWWHRNDASTLDVVPSDDADLSKPPEFAYSLDFINDEYYKVYNPQKRLAKVVKPEFRPKIIKGSGNDKTRE